jgi:hypothetical protein
LLGRFAHADLLERLWNPNHINSALPVILRQSLNEKHFVQFSCISIRRDAHQWGFNAMGLSMYRGDRHTATQREE